MTRVLPGDLPDINAGDWDERAEWVCPCGRSTWRGWVGGAAPCCDRGPTTYRRTWFLRRRAA